jgi:hypothetical protein
MGYNCEGNEQAQARDNGHSNPVSSPSWVDTGSFCPVYRISRNTNVKSSVQRNVKAELQEELLRGLPYATTNPRLVLESAIQESIVSGRTKDRSGRSDGHISP